MYPMIAIALFACTSAGLENVAVDPMSGGVATSCIPNSSGGAGAALGRSAASCGTDSMVIHEALVSLRIRSDLVSSPDRTSARTSLPVTLMEVTRNAEALLSGSVPAFRSCKLVKPSPSVSSSSPSALLYSPLLQ